MRDIRHEKVQFSTEQVAHSGCALVEGPREHRYRNSRPWSVAAFATGSALSAVLLTGTISATLAGTPYPSEQEPKLLTSMRDVAPDIRPASPSGASLESASGWQIQIGSFRRDGAAEAHLVSLAGRMKLAADWAPHVSRSGSLNRARISGFADEVEARGTCASIKERGLECFVVVPTQL